MTGPDHPVERPVGTLAPGGRAMPPGRSVPGADRVVQRGRSKAYRPLPAEQRRAAFDDALAAYRRGDFFEAHELLEPAWMGTADPAERDLCQGLIKLAAAYVHAVRGNPVGVGTNLRGARGLIAASAAADPAGGGLDLPALVEAIDRRLERGPSAAISRPLEDAPTVVPSHAAGRH